jgi:hypothetical protein
MSTKKAALPGIFLIVLITGDNKEGLAASPDVVLKRTGHARESGIEPKRKSLRAGEIA